VFQDSHSSVVYPTTLMALEGTNNSTWDRRLQRCMSTGNSSSAPFQFNYVNVTVVTALTKDALAFTLISQFGWQQEVQG
jgi:hypothetical protein